MSRWVPVSLSTLIWVVLLAFSPDVAGQQHAHHTGKINYATGAEFKPIEVPVGPPVFENISSVPGVVEVHLTATPTRLTLVPGKETDVYAYNGRIPGPLLEVTEGDSVIIHFKNNLPEATTVHWHGLHLPFTSDGSPFHPLEPGAEYVYSFRVQPGTAGTYWYHPHPHHRTGYQVGKGLYGALIVRDPADPLPPLKEQLLILSDNRFHDDGSLDFPEAHSMQEIIDAENGREGNVIFVSGEIVPTLSIQSGEVQRWRIVNASASRVYRLALEGHTLMHIGSDGGLFERPLEVEEVLLSTGERVELLVRGTDKPGSRSVLRTLPYNRYIKHTRPADWEEPRDLAVLQYTHEALEEHLALPTRLRHVAPLDTSAATATRLMVLSQGLINGKEMDINRVDVTSLIGSTEIWEIQNLVGMDHPFHLHGFQFQVLDRNGVPEPFRSWKDTVNVPKRQTVRFIVRYDNFPGKWMFHCHILDHEDRGMMGILEIKPEGIPHELVAQ